MLSKNKIKYIRSLELKKNRKEEKVFVAEGHKLVDDLMGHFPCRLLTGTAEWFSSHPGCHADEVIEVGQEELSRVSLQKTPGEILEQSLDYIKVILLGFVITVLNNLFMSRTAKLFQNLYAWLWTIYKIRAI